MALGSLAPDTELLTTFARARARVTCSGSLFFRFGKKTERSSWPSTRRQPRLEFVRYNQGTHLAFSREVRSVSAGTPAFADSDAASYSSSRLSGHQTHCRFG